MKAKEEVIQTKRITQLGTVREETVSTEEASSPFTKLPRRRVCLNDDSQMRDSIAIPTLSFGASTTDVPKSQEEATSGSDTASLTNDLTESPACDLKAQIEAREERETPFRLALKRAIGSCFNGMMLLDSEIPIYREEACNILWSKYDTVTPSVTPTHQPSVATPLSATHPCISTLIASLPAECEDRPSPLPPSSGTSVTATAEMDAVAASHATTNAPENPQKRKQRKRALWRRNRSKSLIYSIEQNRINYSEIRDTLAALPAKGAEWTGEGEEPTNKEKDTGQPKQRRDTQHWKPPPLIRNVPSKEDLQNIERAYNKLRMEHAQKRPDVQLYESDTESLTLTALIMDEIRRKPACSVQAIREIVWSRGATLRSRHLVWPLILGYLPPDISLWESTLRKKREEYRELIRVWYTSTLDVIRKADEYEKKTGNKMYVDEDLGLLHQIKVDIDRTRPVGFLHMFTHSPIPEMLNRLLITWSKAHPKVGYFQGLNEIPTPLILVFLMPRLKNWENNEDNLSALTEQDYFEVEADAYWCFSAIMDQLTVNFFIHASNNNFLLLLLWMHCLSHTFCQQNQTCMLNTSPYK